MTTFLFFMLAISLGINLYQSVIADQRERFIENLEREILVLRRGEK